ncbi:hypothetical protein INT47_002356 [Mucor saturninus]|uniref:Uncharacterized protein n=1 Tax=Mucor saturninus TaxID=64648 RepID=A0A8H7V126_9FUNG|nr:hypothetical protein INT47_002356 [Mucor saturninus]
MATEQTQVIDDQPLQFEKGLVGDIAKSIMTPGYTANGVIQLMFYTFYALFATLLFMLFMTGGNPHVIALTLIAVCLFVTIKWFIAELEYSKRQDKKE